MLAVAVAWVDMPDESSARAFQRLVDRHGTGNVTELNRGALAAGMAERVVAERERWPG